MYFLHRSVDAGCVGSYVLLCSVFWIWRDTVPTPWLVMPWTSTVGLPISTIPGSFCQIVLAYIANWALLTVHCLMLTAYGLSALSIGSCSYNQ